jgi:2-polyprenyl-3-methyl-5-hydroxy-6-metoxy-1,4-benzoquinol methylase
MEIGFNDNDLGYTYAYRNRFNIIIELLKLHTPLSSTILDVAAAQGNFTLSLAEDGYNMIWNDLRTELIDYVKLKYTKGQIIFQPGNLFDLTFSIRIDAIIITEIIEHVAHPDLFLK